ncbi:carbohydrate ABC transporter permease [Harryflintia acetispora]|uniref:carbohydrate ABC transporter permease n=1 Tax=Harryflintia acetispora TaxID=1849041 RepID=UPI00189B0F41|nr:sugar ABC transporter permease [Harryflintia acetispora]
MSRTKDRKSKLLFLLPGLGYLVLLSIFPLFFSLYLVFCRWQAGSGGIQWVGLQNLIQLVKDERFHHALLMTLCYILLSVFFQMVLGTILALLLHSLRGRFSMVSRVLVSIPILLTPIGMAHIWRIMLDFNSGPVNYFLEALGLPRVMWLGSPLTAIFSIVMVDVWQWMPFVALYLYTALESQEMSVREAARVDGAGGWQMLHYIVLPLLSPYLSSILLLRLIDAIKIFDTIYILTSGGPGSATENITIYAYNAHFRTFNIGYMTAMGWVLVLLTNMVFMLVMRLMRRKGQSGKGE